MKIKTTTAAVTKRDSKYSPISEGNTYVAEPNLNIDYP